MAQAGELAGRVRVSRGTPGGGISRGVPVPLEKNQKLYGVWQDTLLATMPVQSASYFFAVEVCVNSVYSAHALHDFAPPVSFCVFSSKFSPYFSMSPHYFIIPPVKSLWNSVKFYPVFCS